MDDTRVGIIKKDDFYNATDAQMKREGLPQMHR